MDRFCSSFFQTTLETRRDLDNNNNFLVIFTVKDKNFTFPLNQLSSRDKLPNHVDLYSYSYYTVSILKYKNCGNNLNHLNGKFTSQERMCLCAALCSVTGRFFLFTSTSACVTTDNVISNL